MREEKILSFSYSFFLKNKFLIHSVKLSLQFMKPAGGADDTFLETFIAPFHHRLSAWRKDHSLMFMESIVPMACFPLSTGKLECRTLGILQNKLEVLSVKSVNFLCFLFKSQLVYHSRMKGMIHWNWKTSDDFLKLLRWSQTGWIGLSIRNPCILFSLNLNSL